MDARILKKLELKIQEAGGADLKRLSGLVPDDPSFVQGILAGRLYNSFYYQTKRILNREPTSQEFDEFLDFARHALPGLR